MANPTQGVAGVDPLYEYYQQVAGQDGQIDVRELQRCLASAWSPLVSTGTCSLFIDMLDRDYSGKMGFNEFKELFGVVQKWIATFNSYDKDRSGGIEAPEMMKLVAECGFNLSEDIVCSIIKKFDYKEKRRLTIDTFIQAMLILRLSTDKFRQRDTQQIGRAVFAYDDFIQIAVFTNPDFSES